MDSIKDLTKQLTNLLENELKEGKVTVTSNMSPELESETTDVSRQCRINWFVNGLNIVIVFDLDMLIKCTDNINEEIIKPTVLKLKMFKRKQEMEKK